MTRYWIIENCGDFVHKDELLLGGSKTGQCKFQRSRYSDNAEKMEKNHQFAIVNPLDRDKNTEVIYTGKIIERLPVHSYGFPVTIRFDWIIRESRRKNLTDAPGAGISGPHKYDPKICEPDWIKRVFHCLNKQCECTSECKNL